MLVTCVCSAVVISAAPKSEILMVVSSESRMFAGLMSRWATPSLCAKSSARGHLKMISTILSIGIRAAGAQNRSTVPPRPVAAVERIVAKIGLARGAFAEPLDALVFSDVVHAGWRSAVRPATEAYWPRGRPPARRRSHGAG